MFLVEDLFQNEFLRLFFEGYRSSYPEVFCKKVFLKNFAKFTGNTCARVTFLIKLQLQFSTLLKKKLWHRWILRNFKEHILLQNVSGCCLWRVICQAFLKDWNEYLNCRTTFLDSGDIYGWGWNESGQVGVLEEEDNGLQKLCFFPTLLNTPLHITFCQISAGSRHSAGVTIDGELYTWGWNGYGQLCHSDQNTRTSPTKVEFFIGGNFKVVEVVCSQWCTVVKSEHLHEWLVLLFWRIIIYIFNT